MKKNIYKDVWTYNYDIKKSSYKKVNSDYATWSRFLSG